jgi:hypothetical protein
LKIDQKLIHFDENFKAHSSSIKFIKNEIVDLKRDYEKYRDITLNLEAHAIMQDDYLKDAKAFSEDINRVAFGLEDLCSNLMTTDNYLDKYLPFRIQNFISETLENVLPKPQLERLVEFEKYKYKHMHENIIKDEGTSSLKKSYSNLKEQYRVAMGDDSKSNSPKKEFPQIEVSQVESQSHFPGKPKEEHRKVSSKIERKTSKLKDLLIMAKNTPYQYFKDIDSATLNRSRGSNTTLSKKYLNSPIDEKGSTFAVNSRRKRE